MGFKERKEPIHEPFFVMLSENKLKPEYKIRYTLISCRSELVYTTIVIKTVSMSHRLDQIYSLCCEVNGMLVSLLLSLLVSLHSQTVGSREISITGKTFLDISI